MAWKISFKKEALKFLSKQESAIQERIRIVIIKLLQHLEDGILPLNEMDIKRLRGERKDFLRLRIGELRVIFKIEKNDKEIKVYAVDYRGNIYK